MHELFIVFFALFISGTTTNDSEVLQQLWKQLYDQLPDPFLPNRQHSDERIKIKLIVAVESVDFGHTYDDYYCRATLRVSMSWPIVDQQILDSTLIQMAGGSVLLDPNRVWHPHLVIPGARHISRHAHNLELHTLLKTSLRVSMQSTQVKQTEPGGEFTIKDDRGGLDSSLDPESSKDRKQPVQKPMYIFSESVNVEVLCETPSLKQYLGSVHCPIHFKFEDPLHDTPSILWQDRGGCGVSTGANEKLSYLSVSSAHGGHTDLTGAQTSLTLNLCFSPAASVLRAIIPGLVFSLLAFVLMWSLSCGLHLTTISQGILILLTLAVWSISTGAFGRPATTPTTAARFSLLDMWFLLCIAFVAAAFVCTLFEQRRLERILKKRQMQHQRRLYTALNAMQVPPLGGGSGAGSNCGCGCVGYCPSANGYMHPVNLNGQVNQMGSANTPPNLGMTHLQSAAGHPAKVEICNDVYLRSACSDVCTAPSGIMNMGTALRFRCARKGEFGVFDVNESNLGLMKSQHVPSPYAASNLLQPLSPLPPSFRMTICAVALPILFVLANVIFWGSIGSNGTVPAACLVSSIPCQIVGDFEV